MEDRPNEVVQQLISGLKVCPLDRLPAGNGTEYPFPLSIHDAWMFRQGIRDYASGTRASYESGFEDAASCIVRTETAMNAVSKLRDWFVQVEPDYLKCSIDSMDSLLKELESDMDRFEAGIDAQDQG